ncbi:holin [Staphylococcus phage SA3]|uniref:Holin n=8 Tax=Kayvirus TaxID=1857843 RepID=A0A3T0ID95_9CAUD|nr:holin [Staphylococcus phage G15]ARQ96042.1 holin [Staphylococcus phage qdsa002]ASZ77991.1 holin [Staphylococcus phage SA3]AUG85719.1 holin [Staphylococcus phage HSA30]AXU40020.1 holin [Staphylococcus phage VB_SavM_JYL01]AZU97426.1 holin [Staphylococcus phage VB-SavM-JYL02]QEQ93115.1 putative holin [Staphylococcus phage vB_SauH_IME522]QNH71145.1 holin [Staphylococcus phage vB_SauH_SAP1]QWY14812.1 phage holin [Staphylococcus phage SAP23]QZQ74951.1 holin [Staphylococcus phage vB_ScoM-PSC1]
MANETKQPKVVGGINFSTRTKSKTFWVAIISAVAVFANQITGAFGLDYSAQIEQGVNIIGSILTLLAGLGIIVDNNTKGLKDSDIVQTDYIKPRDSKDPNEFVQWQANANTASTFELDNYENNAEPDTDDSDEVPAIEDEIDGGSAPSQDEEDTEEHGKVFAEEEVK